MKPLSAVHRRYLLAMAILLAVIFYLVKCKGVSNPPEPKSKEIHDTITVIKYDNKKLSDSFNDLLKKDYKRDYQDSNYIIQLLNQNSELAVINERIQRELEYPDTCREVVNKLISAHGNYVSQTNKTLDQAKKSLINLSGTIKDQKAYLTEKDKIITRTLAAADSCDIALKNAEKYNKQVKPKRELGLVVSGINDFSVKNFKPAIGGGLSYSNKRGLQFVATYYSNQTGSISIIKPLVRF